MAERSASPVKNEQQLRECTPVDRATIDEDSPMRKMVSELIRFVQHLDKGSTVLGVNKSQSSTLVRIALGSDCTGASAMAVLTATRVAYPVSTVTITESSIDGHTQLQVFIHASKEEYRMITNCVVSRPFPRLMLFLSKSFFMMSVLSFSCLLYAATISPPHGHTG
jgi:hypothetical protein